MPGLLRKPAIAPTPDFQMNNLGPARFVYFFRLSGAAIVHEHRDDLSQAPLLFTCPEAWVPKTQKEFEDAARYYGVKKPEAMHYDSNEVPF